MMPPSAAAAISAMEKGVKVDAEALADAYWNTHGVLPPALLVLHGDEDARVTERNATSMVRLWERLYESAPLARASLTAKRATCPPMAMPAHTPAPTCCVTAASSSAVCASTASPTPGAAATPNCHSTTPAVPTHPR